MNKIIRHFHTDWDKLTGFDWVGIVMTLAVSFSMLIIYLWVWLPANRSKFEQHRDFALKDSLKEK